MSRGPAPEPSETIAANGWRVGMELRTARERLGWDLPAVAAGLRIKQAYLAAIEEGRLADLPGNTYAVGFLRTYAGALGLDPDEVSRRFRAETAEVSRKTELSFPAPVPERGVPAGAVALVGVVLAIGAYVGWYHFSASDRQAARTVPEVPARLAATAGGGTAATTPSPQVASMLPAPRPPAATHPAAAHSATIHPVTAKPVVAPEPAAPPLPDVPPTQAAAAMPPPASATAANVLANPQPTATNPPPVSGAAPAGPHMLLRATADAWVQVREKQGRVLLNRVLRPGETWPVPTDQPQLLLTTGNAGGVELVVDGVAGAPLGSSGAVRRDLPLDPALLNQGGPAPPGSTAPPAAR